MTHPLRQKSNTRTVDTVREFGMAFAFQQAAGGMLNGFFMFGAHEPSHMLANLRFC